MYHIGIDEAGYGPNLGPFVMTVVACRAPRGCLWECLKTAVRRHTDDDDGRTVVADSKTIHLPAKGVGPLEQAVAPWLRASACVNGFPFPLSCLLEKVAPVHLDELRSEAWFHGRSALPAETNAAVAGAVTTKLREAAEAAGFRVGLVRSLIVCAPRFNALIERWDSKAAVLGLGLTELLGHCLELDGDEPFEIIVDKHGGRNQYCALVQHAFPDGFVLPREEGAARSFYEVQCLPRPVRITFMPRAETASFCVALASMISKYLREVLMIEFNQFWASHVPGLKPTAGYPGDSERYYSDIELAVTKLGIAKEKLWRMR